MGFKRLLNILVIFLLFEKGYSHDENYEDTTDTFEDTVKPITQAFVPHQHPHGYPITIMSFASDFNISVDYDNLRKLFLHPEIQNRKAVTISIIGAFRKGKSFIMDYFLRFLYAKYKSISDTSDKPIKGSWMGKPSDPLTGFSWKTSSERHTSGIVFWSDVFLYDAPNGEKYAIYLIDTQGLFDTKTPIQENVKIFGLGTLISSFQIFNLNDVIQEDQLQYLQMATDYAQFAVAENKAKGIKGIKAFQNLLFLMRDWKNVDEYEYGLDEGRRYLLDVLQLEEGQKPELQEVRRYIQASFEKVYCFLMPHPGFGVINNKNYDGRYSAMDVDFRNQLDKLVTWLLTSKNLKVKKVFNETLTAKQMYSYLHSYFDVFQMEAPEVESIYEATVNSQLKGLVDVSLSKFQDEISKIADIKSADSITNLDNHFEEMKAKALDDFKDERKMGSAQQEAKYLKELSTKIDDFFNDLKEHLVTNHRLYQETIAQAEEEKARFEEQLNEIVKANRTQMEEEIKNLQENYKKDQEEIARVREQLEIAKNEMIRNISTDHSLSLQEIETSKNEIQQAYQLKIQQFQIEEQNRIALYNGQIVEKQNEIKLREQAIIEQEKSVEEKLRQQELLQNQRWEREQALKIEQRQFDQMIEERRFEREKELHTLNLQADLQKAQFEKEMEAVRSANREKMLEYQIRIDEIKQLSSEKKIALELEHSKQQQEMQLQILKFEQEKVIRMEKIKSSKSEQESAFLKQLLNMAPALLQIGSVAAAGGSDASSIANIGLNLAPDLHKSST